MMQKSLCHNTKLRIDGTNMEVIHHSNICRGSLGCFLPQQIRLVLPCLTSLSENRNPESLPVLLLVLSLVAGPQMPVEEV